MALWKGRYVFASKQLDAILAEWQDKKMCVELSTYKFALRFLSPLDMKDSDFSIAIGAAAYSIIVGEWFSNEIHDKLTETCTEGYEAGFCVREIIRHYCETRNIDIEKIYKENQTNGNSNKLAVHSC